MKNKLTAVTSHNCDGVGEINPCEPNVGRIKEVHGRELGLKLTEIDVQHFENGETRPLCEHFSTIGCRKINEATRDSCLETLKEKLPKAYEKDMRFNIGNGECKWEIKK